MHVYAQEHTSTYIYIYTYIRSCFSSSQNSHTSARKPPLWERVRCPSGPPHLHLMSGREEYTHRCSLVLTESQKETLLRTGCLYKSWFGNGRSIPLKDNTQAAVDSFNAAFSTEQADVVLLFFMPLTIYHDWISSGQMVRIAHLSGYRVNTDIDLNVVDPDYTLSPICTNMN